MRHLAQRQPQKHVSNVETSVQKASLLEQINHCGERSLAHVCIGTSVDRCQDYKKNTVSIDGQLKGLLHY